nr:xylulose kinase-1 [Tanacetum cinerariifolium]
MEHYLSHTDYPIWQVIQNGNGSVSVKTDTNGMIKVLPPKTAEEVVVREKEKKARTTLLMALPEDHLAKFHKMADAKEMREAIKSRFGGNDESKKIAEIDAGYTGNKARDNGRRPAYQDDSKALVTIDGEDIDWSGHVEEDAQNYAMMAYSSSNSDNEVKSCSKTCAEYYARLKKLYDEQRDKLGDASVEITAYTLALKKFTMSNIHQELASPEANGLCKELASQKQTALGQTTTGKENSNPFMADSLPITILLRGNTPRCDKDSLELKGIDDFLCTLCVEKDELELLLGLSAKTTSWNEFSSTMASAIICLATNQKFNFLSLFKNIEARVPFYMFPRVGIGFSGVITPLFESMLVQAAKEV